MKLRKAIDIIERQINLSNPYLAPEYTTALKLAIESLNYIEKERFSNFPHHIPLLEGETTD